MTETTHVAPTVALDARRIVKTLGRARVLRGLDASFDAGEVHIIEGANGSGKSTLLSVLAGRLPPTSGEVALRGGAGGRVGDANLRLRTGWLGHELGLYPDLTPFENVALHARARGVDPAVTWEARAGLLGILPLANRRVRELSRGQRQRVALVRALAGDPAVVLLDEPSTGLDAASTPRLVDLLTTLRRAGAITVVVTHDATFRDAIGGRCWRLRDGVLGEDGAP